MLYTLIPMVLAIGPALFVVWYYYQQDKQKPEPKGLIVKVFLLGIVVTFPVIIVELIVGKFERIFTNIPLLYYLFQAFVVAALCEEAFKLWIVRKFVYYNINFDEVMDGVVYTVVASLGFACMENILYVLDGGLSTALLRAFTAIPMHALASGTMGYYIGKAKFAANKSEEKSLIYKGLWWAIFIHGLYDFLIFVIPVFGLISGLGIFPLLIVVFIKLRGKIKLALKEDSESGRTAEYNQ